MMATSSPARQQPPGARPDHQPQQGTLSLGGATVVRPTVGRKRSHSEMAVVEADDSNDSIEWAHSRSPLSATTTTTHNNINNNNGDNVLGIPGNRSVMPAPFSHDDLARQRREQVDYSARFSIDDSKAGKVTRPLRVYADGIYDMFHTGHARQLMQAKMAFPNSYLIVGVCSDELTYKMKGRTVMKETERYEALRHCRYVDEVLANAPWSITPAFLEDNKIDFVAHDDLPYTMGSADDIYKDVKAKGMFLPTQRTEGVSTTDVITRIIKDYDMYVRRNLARGYSHKELNVSYVKAKHLKFKDNYEKLETKIKDKGKDWMGKWKEQVGKYDGIIHRWEEKSKEFIGTFIDKFGKDGSLGQWLQENKTRIGRAISPSLGQQEDGAGCRPNHAAYDSPASPSTSDFESASPPYKKGRFSPLFMRGGGEEEEEEVSDQEEHN